jgi:hypothetical protein
VTRLGEKNACQTYPNERKLPPFCEIFTNFRTTDYVFYARRFRKGSICIGRFLVTLWSFLQPFLVTLVGLKVDFCFGSEELLLFRCVATRSTDTLTLRNGQGGRIRLIFDPWAILYFGGKFLGHFFPPLKTYLNLQKWVWATHWPIFFRKLIWSPCATASQHTLCSPHFVVWSSTACYRYTNFKGLLPRETSFPFSFFFFQKNSRDSKSVDFHLHNTVLRFHLHKNVFLTGLIFNLLTKRQR